jgi:four helix bundle protein
MEYEKPNSSFFNFEDLRIYQKAMDYVLWVHAKTQPFPKSERNGLRTRYIAMAQDIAIHIAEGSGRKKIMFIYYLKLAKSSIRECVVFTTICQRLNYFPEASAQESRNTLMEMTKMLNALIASLYKAEHASEKIYDEHGNLMQVDVGG